MLWKAPDEDQLYVYWNGRLIFKRHLNGMSKGQNVVMDLHHAFTFWDEDWKWDNKRYWEKRR